MASFLAIVTQNEVGTTITRRVSANPTTASELTEKRKAQKLEADETKKALARAKEEEQAGPKRFKRASWADANVMPVYLEGVAAPVSLTLELGDSWRMVKFNACAEFGVDAKDYTLTYGQRIEETKKVRGKDVDTRVGEFPFWDGCLHLRKIARASASSGGASGAAAETSSSSSASSE